MRLTAPVYRLKRKAKLLSREAHIPLHEALNRIAAQEGFDSWSLLAAKVSSAGAAERIFPQLALGDLVLVGARPGQGKTLVSLKLAAEAMKSGNRGVLFTLEYTEKDVLSCFRAIGAEPAHFDRVFELDNSDDISADYIVKRLAAAPRGTLVIVDYLQLLDQKRENPELMDQVRTLQSFARERDLIFVFISQIDRSYDPSTKPCPDLEDVRLPNPLDLRRVFSTMVRFSSGWRAKQSRFRMRWRVTVGKSLILMRRFCPPRCREKDVRPGQSMSEPGRWMGNP